MCHQLSAGLYIRAFSILLPLANVCYVDTNDDCWNNCNAKLQSAVIRVYRVLNMHVSGRVSGMSTYPFARATKLRISNVVLSIFKTQVQQIVERVIVHIHALGTAGHSNLQG